MNDGMYGAGALKPLAVTVPNALSITGIGRTKLYELIAAKRIDTITIGKRRLVSYASLEALLRSGAE